LLILLLQLLKQHGVYNLQNYWLILQETWYHQIELQFQETPQAKQQYLHHISFANNNNLHNIITTSHIQQTILFTTINLVFRISIQINTITGQSYTSCIINHSQSLTSPKIINKRSTINKTQVFEPWINSDGVALDQQVLNATYQAPPIAIKKIASEIKSTASDEVHDAGTINM
jgi:hypothetical protein